MSRSRTWMEPPQTGHFERGRSYLWTFMPTEPSSAVISRAIGGRVAARQLAVCWRGIRSCGCDEAPWQQVQKEAPQELVYWQAHHPLPVAMRGISPAESDSAFG